MTNSFIVTSAINTKFGVFSIDERTEQTLMTIKSIKDKVESPNIIVMECSGEKVPDSIFKTIESQCDTYIGLSEWEEVTDIYNSTDNWDIVKNATEMLCFTKVLEIIKEQNLISDGRVFKISGRYYLTDDFNISDYDSVDKIVLKKRVQSQFDPQITGDVTSQFMSRLWSFPYKDIDYIEDTYANMLSYMSDRLVAGGYADIEHCLFKCLDHSKLVEFDKVGISGKLGPNGTSIND